MTTKVDVAKYLIKIEFNQLKEKAADTLYRLCKEYKFPDGDRLNKEEIKEVIDHINYLIDFENEDRLLTSGKEKIKEVCILTDPKIHKDWLSEWVKKKHERYYWDLQKEHLKNQLEKRNIPGKEAKDIIESLDESTEGILKELEDPSRQAFNNKGLVLGYVQSGKTANFSALIAKAADVGYRFIIVLGGIHNVLRSQTQLRIDQEVTGHYDDEKNKNNFIQITKTDKVWNRLTNYIDQEIDPKAKGDFTLNGVSNFNHYFEYDNRPVIAVVKKNCTVLKSLIRWVEKGATEVRSKVPILVIDDEADQASIDTNANKKFIGPKDANPAKTNALIRKLLSLFRRKVYVGYTATPFANLLIGRDAHHIEYGEDLYPRNFIAALPKPDKYFGPERLFGSDLKNQFIKEINDERKEIKGDTDAPSGLKEAILIFILSCAIRLYRKHSGRPMSMLIHVDQKTNSQTVAYGVVDALFKGIKAAIRTKKGEKRYYDFFENLYLKQYSYKNKQRNSFKSDCEAINKALGKVNSENKLPEFKTLMTLILKCLNDFEIVELNSTSEDRLDYRNNPTLKVIAIGGNVLSRGLTLEGLMTSYYLRTTNQSDTLLQMGRWFGYRNDYEDLVRIYTTKTISDSYEKMALLEEMVRDQIEDYVYNEVTPSEVPVAMKIFERIRITAKSKMGSGVVKQAFSDTVVGTTWLPLNQKKLLEDNLIIGERLIDNLYNAGLKEKPYGGGFLFLGTAHSFVENFISEYKYFDKSKIRGGGLDHEGLLNYIRRRHAAGEFKRWNILFAGSAKGSDKQNKKIKWGKLNNLQMVERSRLAKYSFQDGLFNLGVVSSPTDLKADLAKGAKHSHDKRSSNQPLLVIYRIWSGSKSTGENRVPLFAGFKKAEMADVVAYSVVLPESSDKTEKEEHLVQIFTK
jgi:hypothetical protein